MRVLIFEPRHEGHRFEYVRYLLQGLRRHRERGILATSQAAFDSPEFAVHLADEMVHHDSHRLAIAPARFATIRSSLALAKVLREAATVLCPDHILLPSGDGVAQAMGLLSLTRQLKALRTIPMQALFLRGKYGYSSSWQQQLRQRMWLTTIEAGPWKKLFHLDPFQWDAIRQVPRLGAGGNRWGVMPDPVPPPAVVDLDQVREQLGLKNDDMIMVCAGRIDEEKGIPELLAAFSAALAQCPPAAKLLLAGPFSAATRGLVTGEYRGLVESKRIIVIDRILDRTELDQVFAIANLVAAPHRRAYQSSGIVLRGVAAGKPIVGSQEGWIGRAIRQFGVGWTGNTTDRYEFAQTLVLAFHESRSLRFPEIARRWIQFHTPENFVATWFANIPVISEGYLKTPPLPWETVVA